MVVKLSVVLLLCEDMLDELGSGVLEKEAALLVVKLFGKDVEVVIVVDLDGKLELMEISVENMDVVDGPLVVLELLLLVVLEVEDVMGKKVLDGEPAMEVVRIAAVLEEEVNSGVVVVAGELALVVVAVVDDELAATVTLRVDEGAVELEELLDVDVLGVADDELMEAEVVGLVVVTVGIVDSMLEDVELESMAVLLDVEMVDAIKVGDEGDEVAGEDVE